MIVQRAGGRAPRQVPRPREILDVDAGARGLGRDQEVPLVAADGGQLRRDRDVLGLHLAVGPARARDREGHGVGPGRVVGVDRVSLGRRRAVAEVPRPRGDALPGGGVMEMDDVRGVARRDRSWRTRPWEGRGRRRRRRPPFRARRAAGRRGGCAAGAPSTFPCFDRPTSFLSLEVSPDGWRMEARRPRSRAAGANPGAAAPRWSRYINSIGGSLLEEIAMPLCMAKGVSAGASRGRQGEEEGRALARRRLDPDLPPCRSTIFLTTARPIPVPSYSSWVWRRWNISKIRSRYSASIPIPLSGDRELPTSRPAARPRSGSRAARPGAGT